MKKFKEEYPCAFIEFLHQLMRMQRNADEVTSSICSIGIKVIKIIGKDDFNASFNGLKEVHKDDKFRAWHKYFRTVDPVENAYTIRNNKLFEITGQVNMFHDIIYLDDNNKIFYPIFEGIMKNETDIEIGIAMTSVSPPTNPKVLSRWAEKVLDPKFKLLILQWQDYINGKTKESNLSEELHEYVKDTVSPYVD